MTEAAEDPPPDRAAVEVERSVAGRRWRLRAGDERLARALSQRFALPDLVGRILATRGIGLEAAEDFLNPRLRALLPDPSCLKDMDRAAERIVEAILRAEPVAVFADYDVDGAASAALLHRFLAHVGTAPSVYVPDRLTEGYGPNAAALTQLQGQGAGLVLTVDCGTTAIDPLTEAARIGLDVVVIDHHIPDSRLPPAVAVVNPNRIGEPAGLGQLCACGVAFLTVVAVNRLLRRHGHYRERAEPDLLSLLDLVMLATICDVVPLTGLNRAFVVQGLKAMNARRNPGLAALAGHCSLSGPFDPYHMGFVLGPRINAGGRVGRSDLGARLLSTDDPSEAARIAAALDAHNEDRKAVEAAVLAAASGEIEGGVADPVIVVAGEDWHPGVLGSGAGRLRERYDRPVCAVAMDGDIGKASGRSVPGFNLGAAIVEATRAGLLLAGGGHPMAAGFTVRRDRLPALRRFLSEHVRALPAGGLPAPTLLLDGALQPAAATVRLAQSLATLAPFGPGNPEPRLALANARILAPSVVGSGHVRCRLAGAEGGSLKAIAFRVLDTPLGESLLRRSGAPLHVAGSLRLNRWNGAVEAQFHIHDAAPVWPTGSPNAVLPG